MLSIDDLPQSLRDNVAHVEFPFHPTAAAMMVTFKNGLDASVVSGPGTYGGQGGLFELAVGFQGEGIWEDCPLTEAGGITGWLTQEDLIDLLSKVAEYDDPHLSARRRHAELELLETLGMATQFGILRLAGLGENDNPYDYLEAADLGESLGLDHDAVQALRYLRDLIDTAEEKLNREHLAQLVAEDEKRKGTGN